MGDSGDGGDGSFGMPPADCRNCHPYPLHDGHDDGDGVLGTATTVKIIVTTVTHRHTALKLALRQSFFLRECEYFHTGYDTREAIYLH